MTGFSADWLGLRAGADDRARAPGLAARLGAHFAGRAGLRVLDLGSGTGANLRVTGRMIGVPQHWLLVDNDPALLARADAQAGSTVERRVANLAGDLSSLFDPPPDLVTGSAFLDLCGADWLGRLADAVTRHRAALYMVLSYDGREEWAPAHPLDAEVLAAFHADQRRDKGLGQSLGPDAHDYLTGKLRDGGYEVREARSDWRLEQPRDAALIGALAQGSADATARIIGAEKAEKWRTARAMARRVVIGHKDLLALPPVSPRVSPRDAGNC